MSWKEFGYQVILDDNKIVCTQWDIKAFNDPFIKNSITLS